MNSRHYTQERQEREHLITNVIGKGKVVKRFKVDRGHKNGPEIHEISDTGIITIYNERTGKLVTRLIARPAQLKRYFAEGKTPKELLNKAYENTVRHDYNNR